MTGPTMPAYSPGSSYPPELIPPKAEAPKPGEAAAAAAPAPARPTGGSVLDQPLSGEGVPSEMQGKTVAEMARIYSALREDHLERLTRNQAPARKEDHAAAAPTDQAPATSAQPTGRFWTKPEEYIQDTVQRSVEDTINRALGPTIQATRETAVRTARDKVAAKYPEYVQHEKAVLDRLSQVDPQFLSNAVTWESAYHLALGASIASGATPRPPANQKPEAKPYYAAPPGAFYAEPARSTTDATAGRLSPEAATIAQKLGMTEAQYLSWQGGSPR